MAKIEHAAGSVEDHQAHASEGIDGTDTDPDDQKRKDLLHRAQLVS